MSQRISRSAGPSSTKVGVSLLLIAVILTLFVVALACNLTKTANLAELRDSQASQIYTEKEQVKDHQVIIQNINFSPPETDIKIGDSVTWLNKDTGTHTVTSWHQYQDDNHVAYTDIGTLWDSGDIKTGLSFSRTFNQAGVFEYISLPLYYYMEFGQTPVGIIIVNE